MTGLYLHIPFCRVKCKFCAFAAFPGRLPDIPRYLNALNEDVSNILSLPLTKGGNGGVVIDTLYVGGGTPTLLDPAQWNRLFETVQNACHSSLAAAEITVESNPEDLTPGLASHLRHLGVNRLSLGLQSTHDHHLESLGRLHDWSRFRTAWRDARGAGFSNLNVDLMYGLPDQTLDEWRESLERVLDLGPEHLSAYALTVEEKTAFGHHGVETDDDLQADMYHLLADRLEGEGFVHYEISNFAKPGFESKHNLKYWRNETCLGAGVSSAWYHGGTRRKNTDNLTAYMESVEAGRSPVAEEVLLSAAGRAGELLMLGLRTKEGSPLTKEGEALFGSVLRRHAADGLLVMGNDRVRPTRKGWLLSNRIFKDLLTS